MSPVPLPGNALVMLVGAAASGKSTWAHAHFRDTEIVSSDQCRALVSDDETDQSVNAAAFRVFYEILVQRTALGRLSVADSTALQAFARARLRQIAARAGAPVHAVVFRLPVPLLLQRNRGRARQVPEPVLVRQAEALAQLDAEGVLDAEGYDAVHRVRGDEPVIRTPPVVHSNLVDTAVGPGGG
jgi:protein phosphatase